jgi:protein ImuB
MDIVHSLGRGEKRMNRELYACIHATEFAAQALLRLRTDLKGEPVAIVDGPLHDACVCSMNRAAAQRGVVRGLPRMDAEALNGLKILDRSLAVEQAARTVMLEVAAQFTPRMEVVPAGVGSSIVLDVMGSELLFGSPNVLATKIKDAMEAVGLRVSVVLSANFHTARLKAAAHRGLCIVAAGAEADTLALLPLHALDLSFEQQEKFELWGIRSFADLAALPEAELIARLGARAREWQAMARGAASHTFQPIEAAFALREVYEFDTPVEQEEGLLFIAARMLDCLVDRAMAHALALASLTAELVLEGAPSQSLSVHPALPSQDKRFLLKLLQMELSAHPPQAAVLSMTLYAEPGKTSKVQMGLFAPQTPEAARLDVTLARIKAMVGEDRVGTPVLEDSHRPASFHLDPFRTDAAGKTHTASLERTALRRVRPPRTLEMMLADGKPGFFRDLYDSFRVTAAYGPWRTSGAWWSVDAWDQEEWDVMARDSRGQTLCFLLAHDRLRAEWRLEALLD